jgi:hypothetical protein
MQYIYEIASDLGVKEIVLGNLYIGGCRLSQHLDNATNDKADYTYYTTSDKSKGIWFSNDNVSISEALADKEWDFIIFQQGVSEAGFSETYNDLIPLAEYVRERCPNAHFGWQMTWADQKGSMREDFKDFDCDQIKMYNAIANADKEKILDGDLIETFIPTGTAIQNVRGSSYGDKLTRDGYHLSLGMGRYTAGVTWVASLTGIDISNLKYAPSGIMDSEKQIVISAVKSALKNPTKISKI